MATRFFGHYAFTLLLCGFLAAPAWGDSEGEGALDHLGNPDARALGRGVAGGAQGQLGQNPGQASQVGQGQLSPMQQFQQFQQQQMQQMQSLSQSGRGATGGGGGAREASVQAGDQARQQLEEGAKNASESIKSSTESFLSGLENFKVEEDNSFLEQVAGASKVESASLSSVDDIINSIKRLSDTQVQMVKTISQMFQPSAAAGVAPTQPAGQKGSERLQASGLGGGRITGSPLGQIAGNLGGSSTNQHSIRGIGARSGADAVFDGISAQTYRYPEDVKLPPPAEAE